MPPAGRCPHRPRHSTTKPLLTSVGGGVPDTPNEQRTSSYISERKRQRRQRRDDTKLRHHPTENPLVDRKGRYTVVSADFWHAFRCFSRAGEVPRRRHGQADLPANLSSHGKKQTRRNSRRVLICQKVSQSSRLWSREKNPIRFFAAARTPQKTLCAQRSVAAPPIAGQGVERSESRFGPKRHCPF